jgi:ParB-like chromosome segregation protein Spo0J
MTPVLAKDSEWKVPVSTLGERLGGLRLREQEALESIRRSLSRHGQLTAIVVFPDGQQLEILDGFKRVHGARTLGWTELGAKRSDVGVADAKVQMAALHDRRGLAEIEEGWIVRSLYRDDGLSQPEIARRMGRHKSWVCRRLMLVEALDAAVQAEVRLGLLAPRAAVTLAQLPRGNQHAASTAVIRRGLTVRQTELLAARILEHPDEAERAEGIASRLQAEPGSGERTPTRARRNEADWMASDISTLLRVAARLEARLLATPLGAFEPAAGQVVFDALVALVPVLAALASTIAKVTGKERAA